MQNKILMGAKSKMSKYQALIIGAGGQGSEADQQGNGNSNKIISFAHAFREHPGFHIEGITDKSLIKADIARKAWDIKWWGHGENSYKMFFRENARNDKIDIAVVSTPDDTHYKILKQLAEYPLKLVICEKPICTDLQQAGEIVELYKAKGIALMVNYTRRFLPYYENLKRRYEDGEFGKLLHYEAFFNRGILHTGSHMVDFLTWFFDFELLDGLELNEINSDYRIWQVDLFFEKYHWREERIGFQDVWPYYDKTHWHVVSNAFEYLEGNEPLKCSGEDALKSLEICFELMEGK